MRRGLVLILGAGIVLAPRWCVGAPARSYAVTDLGAMAAYSLNAGGQIAGVAYEGLPQAALWTRGERQDLGTLRGGYSVAQGLNSTGQMAGISDGRAFLWADQRMTDLGTLGGTNSYGLGINEAGEVVGAADRPDGTLHAFLYQADAMRDLGALRPGLAGIALGINGSRRVVGYGEIGNGETHAFLWSNETGMVDLNAQIDPASGWELMRADGINEAGQIVGLGSHNGVLRSFLLTPR